MSKECCSCNRKTINKDFHAPLKPSAEHAQSQPRTDPIQKFREIDADYFKLITCNLFIN